MTAAASRLVAGIGFRHGARAEAIVALIGRALAEAGLGDRLVAIATAADRAGEPAIRDAAAAFGLVPLPVSPDALARVDHRVPTRSARIERLRGIGSLAEAAALAVAGEAGRLALPRVAGADATCALARVGGDAVTDARIETAMPIGAAFVPAGGGRRDAARAASEAFSFGAGSGPGCRTPVPSDGPRTPDGFATDGEAVACGRIGLPESGLARTKP